MDISAQIMELERQVKATEYATKKHEDELRRLHGEVAKSSESLRRHTHELEPKEKELKDLTMRLANVEREISSKRAALESEKKSLGALQSREKKEEGEVVTGKKNATSLKQKLDAQRRTAQRLNDLKKKTGF